MTGELFTAQWIDYETDAIDMFTVVVFGGVHSATLDVAVNIEDVEDSVSTLSVSKANPVPGVYQGNPEHVLDDLPHGFVETEWANWNAILRIGVTSESPESDCGTGLDCVRLHVEADGSEDEQELVAMRTGAQGHKYVAAVKLVETEAAGGETIEVIGADGTARLVQVLQVGEDDEVEIEFDNLRGSVDVENGPPEFTYFQPDHGSTFDDQDVDFYITVQDAESGLPEPEDLPDRDGDHDYTPVAALVHDSQCYNSSQDEDGFAAVENLRLRDGAIYCFGQPEIRPIDDDRDFDEIDNGYDVETTIVLPEGETHYVTFVVCDRSGNCIAYDADEDSDIALVELTPEQDDPCLATITDDSTIEGNWDGTCPSGREPEPYGGSGDRYARYYTFTLSATSNITIALTSSEDTYLYLLEGVNKGVPYLYENDDITPGSNLNSRIEQRLQPGEYTIEATTHDPDVVGDFQLAVRMSLDAGARCRNGVAMPSPYNSIELVNDCVTLLHTRFWVDVDRSLDWKTDTPIHEWEGVTIDGSTAAVVGLELPERGLRGTIPPELSNLSSLRLLNLRHNDLTGNIPPDVGNLVDLEVLNLADNFIDGAIPSEILGLFNLTRLQLGGNLIEDQIPAELGDLTALTHLELDRNRIAGGIPSELGNLTNLRDLYLYNNDLTGYIPKELSKLPYLKDLQLHRNHLTGEMPPELGDIANLEILYLSFNELEGGIPSELGNLQELRELDLEDNQLTGQIPTSLAKLTELEYTDLRRNQITGCIPFGMKGVVETDPELPICPRRRCFNGVEASLSQPLVCF